MKVIVALFMFSCSLWALALGVALIARAAGLSINLESYVYGATVLCVLWTVSVWIAAALEGVL